MVAYYDVSGFIDGTIVDGGIPSRSARVVDFAVGGSNGALGAVSVWAQVENGRVGRLRDLPNPGIDWSSEGFPHSGADWMRVAVGEDGRFWVAAEGGYIGPNFASRLLVSEPGQPVFNRSVGADALFGSTLDNFHDVATVADGAIAWVQAGGGVPGRRDYLVKYDSELEVDASFGVAGQVDINAEIGAELRLVDLDADELGRVHVVGCQRPSLSATQFLHYARFTPEGALEVSERVVVADDGRGNVIGGVRIEVGKGTSPRIILAGSVDRGTGFGLRLCR